MKTLIITISLLGAACFFANAQKKSVVIGTMISKPNAVLVLNPPNSDQGFLLPQLDSKQREGILPTSPQDDGLMVYDISEKSFYHWNEGAWIKGLGSASASQLLSYDPSIQRLTLSGGNFVDLAPLKEVPSQTTNAGKFLTTNGTTLSWATLSSLGDITAIITSATSGLSGGAATGDVNLSVNTDATTISVNGSNQLQLSNGAVSTAKIANNAVNSTHIIDGSVSSADILDNSIATADLANAAVTGAKIGVGAVTTTNLASGGNNKVLTTSPTGIVTWEDQTVFGADNQNLSLAANALAIDGGTGVNLNNVTTTGDVAGPLNAQVIQPGVVNSAKILDASISTADLANSAVTSVKIGAGEVATTNIASGGNDKVLTTNATGVVNWLDRSTFADDNQNLTLAANALGIDGGTGVNLNNLTTTGDVAGLLNSQVIQTGAVNSLKILDGSITGADLANAAVTNTKIAVAAVTTTNIASGGNNKILTTDATGVVTWNDISTLAGDNQNLSLATNLLAIEDGTGVDLNNLTTTGDVAGPLNSQTIQTGAVNSLKILDGSVANADLANGSVTGVKIGAGEVAPVNITSGGNSKVLTTTPAGLVFWDDISNIGGGSDNQNLTLNVNLLSIDNGTDADLNNLQITGDIQGNLNNAIIQPNTVSTGKILNGTILPADMAAGGANQVLVTNGTGTGTQWSTPAGDVTGAVSASTVARIQGRNVSNAAPTVGDLLVWDGTAWTPQAVSATPTTQYLSIDPSAFEVLENSGSDDKAKLGLFDNAGDEGRTVWPRGNARKIMAPVTIPHGATIEAVTIFYRIDNLLGLVPFTATLYRKALNAGTNAPIATLTPLLGLVGNYSAPLPTTATVVDNSANSYRMLISIPLSGDADDPTEANLKFYGVSIRYTK